MGQDGMVQLRKVGSIILISVGVWIILLATVMNWGDLFEFGGSRAVSFVINLLVGIFSVEIGILGLKGWKAGGIYAIVMGVGEIIGVILGHYFYSLIQFSVYGLPAIGIELILMGLKWEIVIVIIGGVFLLAGGNLVLEKDSEK